MKKGFVEILIGITILVFLITPVFADPSPRAIPISATGELTILQVDDFDNKISKTLYRLRDLRTNKTYKLKFRGEPPEKFRTGEIVAVRGKAEGRVLLVAGMAAVQLESEGLVTAGFSGEQRTIVIVANFLDQSVSCSASDIQNTIFTDPSNQSVDDLYQEMSFGQLWFSGRVTGPFLINYGSTSSCNLSAWADAADAAARASGVDLSIYNRKVYVMPRNNPCGYTGVATLGGNPSMAWIFRCDGNDVYAHELGHNLGMHHAATPTNEYGDTSDIMGYSGFGLRHVNAPHKDQEGWLSSEQTLSVVESGTYHIAPLELDAASTLDPQVLLIAKPDTGESYYLSYRQPIDFDATLSSTYTKGVNIHRHTTGTSTKTYLLSVLADGGILADATNGITITQTSHTNQYATVQIQLNNTPVCSPSTPTMSISPSSQSAQAGSTLTYSVSLTNMDNADCSQTTFSLARFLPTGWTGSLSPSSLTLAPGATGSSTLSVGSPSTAAAGSYILTAQASDGTLGIHTTSRSTTYAVLPKPSCTSASPVVSLSPTSQSALPGSTLGYSVSVKNMDSAECSQTTFSLANSLPAGWTATLSPSSLTLVPGATGSSTLSLRSSTSAAPGNYSIKATATDTANASHASSGSATCSVLADTQPPTVPAGLTASSQRRQVSLSWTKSTDNVGVKAYRIWRNNAVIAETGGTSYIDSSVSVGQTYTYSVTAYDAAGNASAGSNQVAVTVRRSKK